MSANNFDTPDPAGNDDAPEGADRYLHPGENLRSCSSDIQIKKFRFEAYLTNKRLFLIDQNDRKSGITAKEIPVQSIISSYLEESPSREPVLVLSVRTSDDDIRTMKMTFVHTGEDRAREAEEWVHLISQAVAGAIPVRAQGPGPVTAPEARPLSDTMVFPVSQPSPAPAMKADGKSPRESAPARPAASRAAVTPPIPATQIVYCFHCGKKLPGNANFCPFCGTRVHENHHDEESHLHLPLHQYRDQPQASPKETNKKTGWRRFFGR
ncbi:MAG: zinc ribbon domain-containing protein [Methanoregulaceae archaeon]|nr:zinc ribbon domain-containing protein [Methanoregulaceae archaeon]